MNALTTLKWTPCAQVFLNVHTCHDQIEASVSQNRGPGVVWHLITKPFQDLSHSSSTRPGRLGTHRYVSLVVSTHRFVHFASD